MKFPKFIMGWISSSPEADGKAVHVERDDGCHEVVMDCLRVVIVRDGAQHWFAQSLDIDYASGGETLDEAQKNFERGLAATIRAHIIKFGHLNKLMQDPPHEELAQLGLGEGFQFSMATRHQAHEIEDAFLAERLNCHRIAYRVKDAA